jgi:mRNA-degrading endonuclease RelE of RelBE toxin-antitoxin system
MSTFWLKMIAMVERPLSGSYAREYVDFARRPRRIHPGDHMILYAVGGSKRVFALAEVTSEVYDGGNEKRYPYRADVRYDINLPVSGGVHIDEVSTAGRDLARSIRRASYIELSPEEYERAATNLQESASSRSSNVVLLSDEEILSIRGGLAEMQTEQQINHMYPSDLLDSIKTIWHLPARRSLELLGPSDSQAGRGEEKFAIRAYSGPAPEWFLGMTHEFTKSINKIDRKLQGRVLQAISHIAHEPTVTLGDTVKRLAFDSKGLWRYRLGDFRLIYHADQKNKHITLVSFASRGDVYEP